MAETYDITYENEPVGRARMEREGLYLHFFCRCRLPDSGLYRIHVISGGKREDLGICVPVDGAFGMDKRIPAKRLGEETPTFELLPKDWSPHPAEIPEPAAPIEEENTAPEPVEETPIPEAIEEVSASEPAEETPIPEPMEEAPDVEPVEEAFVSEPMKEASIPEPAEEMFVPVSEEEPFAYLDQLENAVLAERDDQPGILIRETTDEKA